MFSYILISVVLFFAAFVFGTAGFGFGLVSVPLLSLVVNPKLVVPFVLVYAYGINLVLLLRFRSHIRWAHLWPLMVGACPGIPLGIYFLKHAEHGPLKQAVGVVVILYVFWSLVFKKARSYDVPRPWAFVAGFASGVLSGAFALPGPPALVYVTLHWWKKTETRATIHFFFFFVGTWTIFGQIVAHVLTLQVLRFNLFYLPLVVVGGGLGYMTFKRLSPQVFNTLLLYLLLVIGILLIISSWDLVRDLLSAELGHIPAILARM
jgi:uncharacterized membrane protein YfcA